MAASNTPVINQPFWVGGSEGLEKSQLDLGFIPLTDCAPLVIAHEKGFFERHGLTVNLHREGSWASIRDKTALGLFDAAHMLYPMPIAMSLGIGGFTCPMQTALCLSLGGNAITVSNSLHASMTEEAPELMESRLNSAAALKKVIENRRAITDQPLRFGVVFPTSTHHYELRFWMASAGIDPDQDVRLMVVPPPEMPDALRNNKLDGYCVGEPWNSYAVQRGWGKTLITKHELWSGAPEKVLAVTSDWATLNPGTHLALVRSVLEACVWCDQPSNREEVAEIIARKPYVNAPLEVVRTALLGQFRFDLDQPLINKPDFFSFHRYAANFPWRSHAIWFLTQMKRWGQFEQTPEMHSVIEQVMRPDIFRQAAEQLGVPAPTVELKPEGTRPKPWTLADATQPIKMCQNQFIDGCSFDPSRPDEYLKHLAAPDYASGQAPTTPL